MEYNTNPHRGDKMQPVYPNQQQPQNQPVFAQPVPQQVGPRKTPFAKCSLFLFVSAVLIMVAYLSAVSFFKTDKLAVMCLAGLFCYVLSLICMIVSRVKERGTRKSRAALGIHIVMLTMILTTFIRKNR